MKTITFLYKSSIAPQRETGRLREREIEGEAERQEERVIESERQREGKRQRGREGRESDGVKAGQRVREQAVYQ